MVKKITHRVAWGTAVILAVALGSLAWSQAVSRRTQGRKDRPKDEMWLCFDSGEPFVPARGGYSAAPLKLVIEPRRVRGLGLVVRIEVWNPSDEDKLVYPIGLLEYYLFFRDKAGQKVDPGYWLLPAYPYTRAVSELSRIAPGNCLAANYMLPRFYKRVTGASGVECQARIDIGYRVDPEELKMAEFKLASNWVKVPPP